MSGSDTPQVPLCSVCNHMHEQGIKCPVCGHKGKGKVYQLLQHTVGPSSMELHFESFLYTDNTREFINTWMLVRILRQRLFVNTGQMTESEEFDECDVSCKHVLGFIGDAPICIARWRVIQENGSDYARVERLGVLPSHRQKKYGKQLLEFVVKDIMDTLKQSKHSISGLVADVPGPETDPAWRTFVSCGFQSSMQNAPFEYRSRQCLRMYRFS